MKSHRGRGGKPKHELGHDFRDDCAEMSVVRKSARRRSIGLALALALALLRSAMDVGFELELA